MKNPFLKKVYREYVIRRHRMKTYRGGWMLTHSFYEDYKWGGVKNLFKIMKAHSKGWSYRDWLELGLSKKTERNYLSTRDYYSMHPLNDEFSVWIDDKLTLKHMLHGTKLGKYMPKYYFHIQDKSRIMPMMDYSKTQKCSSEDVAQLLKNEKTLAFKKVKSSIGKGFIKAVYDDLNGKFYFNEKEILEEDIINEIEQLNDYLVMEYIKPHATMSKYCEKSSGCLRYIIGRMRKGDIKDIVLYLRIGTEGSGYVENYGAGGIRTYVDITNGKFKGGMCLNMKENKNEIITVHPDNGLTIEGVYPKIEEIKTVSREISNLLPQLDYMGFDYCVTDKEEIKLYEINSLPGLMFQQDWPVYLHSEAKEFFSEKLNEFKK